MKMSRSQMISIINSMSDDSLTQALSAAGVETGGGEDSFDPGAEMADGIESWNAREVSVPAVTNPPLVDKSKFEKPAVMAQRPYAPGPGDAMDGISEYIPTDGMQDAY